MSRRSYKTLDTPKCIERPTAAPTQITLCPTDDQNTGLTVHRSSYEPWPNAKRSDVMVPRDHEMLGDCCRSPMQSITSNCHDYQEKIMTNADRPRILYPVVHLRREDGPMDVTTTTAITFGATGTAERRPSARPSTSTQWTADGKQMASETVSRCSYRPWEMPYVERCGRIKRYCRPNVAVDNCSTYASSYGPPGMFRDPRPGEQKIVLNDPSPIYPRAHDYNL